MIYSNFKQYKPTDANSRLLADSGDVIFIRDDSENDWYELLETFPDSAWKLRIDANNVVRGFTKDASLLFPDECSVAVVDSIPEGLDTSGRWVWEGDSVVERAPTKDELIALADRQKDALMVAATAAIAPLQGAVDLDIATDAELAQLKAWKTYRVLLSRVDVSKAPDIKWPEKPEE